MNATYLKGDDVTVTADGSVIGGVLGVECGRRNSVEKIEEYLTDVPVAQFPKTVYYVTLRLQAQPYATLGFVPAEVSLICGSCRVSYTDCCVEHVKGEILPHAAVEYTVTLTAGERSVENV